MTINIACLGAGNISGRHLNNLQAMSDVQIVGIADILLARAQEHAGRYGCHAYRDYQEMVEREHPDALWICVPPFVHGEPEAFAVAHKLLFLSRSRSRRPGKLPIRLPRMWRGVG